MKCPSCNSLISNTSEKCSNCGFLAPSSMWFLNIDSFSMWEKQKCLFDANKPSINSKTSTTSYSIKEKDEFSSVNPISTSKSGEIGQIEKSTLSNIDTTDNRFEIQINNSTENVSMSNACSNSQVLLCLPSIIGLLLSIISCIIVYYIFILKYNIIIRFNPNFSPLATLLAVTVSALSGLLLSIVGMKMSTKTTVQKSKKVKGISIVGIFISILALLFFLYEFYYKYLIYHMK